MWATVVAAAAAAVESAAAAAVAEAIVQARTRKETRTMIETRLFSQKHHGSSRMLQLSVKVVESMARAGEPNLFR